MALKALFNGKAQTPEVTPAPPIVTPEEKQPQAEPAAAAPAEPAQTEKKKTRRGKPQDRSRLTRNKVVQIRLTEKEVSDLKAAATAADMTLADYVMAIVYRRKVMVFEGAGELLRELRRQGTNLNQVIRLAYQTGMLDPEEMQKAVFHCMMAQSELMDLCFDAQVAKKALREEGGYVDSNDPSIEGDAP